MRAFVRQMDAALLEHWHHAPDYKIFLVSVEAKIEHQLRRAERWLEELKDLDTDRERELKLADYVRQEQFAKSERRIIRTCNGRFTKGLTAPEEAPAPAVYVGAWVVVVLIWLYFAYYLATARVERDRFDDTSL